MTTLDLRMLGAIVTAAALLGGCRVESGLPKNNCVTTSDCDNGSSCQQGVCVGGNVVSGGGGGGCATVPASACSQPEGTEIPLDPSEILRLLPGRWLWCTGDPISGVPLKLGGDDTVGIEFSADATLWWFLIDDGHGHPVHRDGFDSSGTVDILGMPNFVQLNLVVTGSSHFTLNPSFTEGPPKHMRLVSHGPAAYYVHDDSCSAISDAPDMATGDGDMGGGAFGGACDPNTVYPDSCPGINGVACSICGYASMTWQCLQPCHVAANDCTAPQSCIALPEFTLSGDCISYDGYCQ